MITSFIIHHLGWHASNVFWGHLSEMLLYRASEATTFVNTCRLLVTYRISVSALAIMHSPRSADFRWPRSRRRQTTPPHSRSSNRLKQETPRPTQFPQDDPSFPAGSGIRTSASPPR